MAGKKDKNVVCVISGLTDIQANNIVSEIGKAKNKHAPRGRGTMAVTSREGIAKLLQGKTKEITGK